jgi:hypothetical protein
MQIHKRPARQQVRCASFITQTRSLGQRFLCLSLSLSIHQILRSSNAWLSTPERWGRGRGELAREREVSGRMPGALMFRL